MNVSHQHIYIFKYYIIITYYFTYQIFNYSDIWYKVFKYKFNKSRVLYFIKVKMGKLHYNK